MNAFHTTPAPSPKLHSIFGAMDKDTEQLLVDGATRVNNCIEAARLTKEVKVVKCDTPLTTSFAPAYALYTTKGVNVFDRKNAKRQSRNSVIEQEDDPMFLERNMSLALLNRDIVLDEHLKKHGADTYNLPALSEYWENTKHACESIDLGDNICIQLSPNRSFSYFLPNIENLAKKFNASQTNTRISSIAMALDASCSRHPCCMYQTSFFPHVKKPGPVVLYGMVETLLKRTILTIVDNCGLTVFLDLLWTALGDGKHYGSVENICICCLLTDQEKNCLEFQQTNCNRMRRVTRDDVPADRSVFLPVDADHPGCNRKLFNVRRPSRVSTDKKCISDSQNVWYQNVDHLASEINIIGDDVYQIGELPFADYEVFPKKNHPGKFGVRMKHR